MLIIDNNVNYFITRDFSKLLQVIGYHRHDISM